MRCGVYVRVSTDDQRDKKEMFKYFSKKLEELDNDYKNFPVIASKYINFVMAKIMEMTKEE